MSKASRRRKQRAEEFSRSPFLPPMHTYLLTIEGVGMYTGTFNAVYAMIEDHCGSTARVEVCRKSYKIFGRHNAILKRR